MFDLLISGGWIVDGSGNIRYLGDVGVAGERIVAIGNLRGQPARRVIAADGLVVCPGFVDMHSHSDILWLAQPDAGLCPLACGLVETKLYFAVHRPER